MESHSITLSREKLTDLLSILGYYIVYEDENSIMVNRSSIIKSVYFKGNFHTLDSNLLNISGITLGDPWYMDTYNNVKENITEFYRNNGFLDVDIEINFEDGNLYITIDEGERYYLDEYDIVIDDKITTKSIPVKLYSEKNLEKEIENTLKSLRKEFYLSSKILRFDLIKKGHKRFYLSNDPLSSLISLIKSGIVVKPTIYISKGERYDLEIKGAILPYDISLKLKDQFLENFKSFSTFDLRELELTLEDYLTKLGFIKPEVNIESDGIRITLYVDYESFIKNFNVEVFLNNERVNELIDEHLKSLIISCQDDEAKRYMLDKLKSEGYETITLKDYSIKRTHNDVHGTIYIDLGSFKHIKKIFVNNLEYKSTIKYSVSQNDIEQLRKDILNSYAEKCLIKGLTLQKIENDNVYFVMNCSQPQVTSIISNHEEVVGKIKKRFFSDNKVLTTSKFQQIHDYLLRNKNSEKVYLEPIEMDNETILVMNLLKAKENRIYGSLSYDSVDKFSAELGYNRFDILNSGRTFQISLKKSFLETSSTLSLSGQKTLHKNIDDFLALSFKDRDEYDFRYREALFTSLIRLNYENLQTIIGFGAASLDIYDTDFSDYYNRIYENNYNLFSIPFKINYKTKNYESFIGYGLSGTVSATPIFSERGNFFEGRGKIEGYKQIFTKDLILKLTLETQYLQGNKDDIPVTHLLTLGGPQRMKAFNYREIGFKDPKTSVTIGNKNINYSNLFIGYKPMEQVIVGPFFEYAGYGDSFNNLEYVKDIGIELIISQQNVGYFSASFSYAPFEPYKGSNAFYINFGVNF